MPSVRGRSKDRYAEVARFASALEDGRACEFVLEEAEAQPGVRSAALVPPGPVATSDLRGPRMLVVPIGDPPFAALACFLEAAPTAELEQRLAAIASVAAPLLLNERRLADARRAARRDPLTGLPNRRALGEYLESLGDKEVAVVFCDLDGFKRVNDEQGYRGGDRVLRQVGRIVAAELRSDEQLFRIGGDEFCVVLEEGHDAAVAVAARLAASVRARGGAAPLPGLSVGVSTAPAAAGVETLIGQASESLAAGRKSGSRARRAPSPRLPLAILVVDDDAGLRLLLRTTFELDDLDVLEAANAAEARALLADRRPDAVVLDVNLPDGDGVAFARELRAHANPPGVLLLTGGDVEEAEARAAGAQAVIKKPFSPLELLDEVYRVAGVQAGTSSIVAARRRTPLDDQLLLYATDLRRLLEAERRQHEALGRAYHETLGALANALETRDTGTAAHSQRVQRYASEIAAAVEPGLLGDPSVEYGFLLHDIGKIGIPDQLLRKPGKLTAGERRLMQTHAPLGASILGEVGLLHGQGLAVVRHHHERWDGAGYPDGLKHDAIPLAARIFAVADALDAITSNRPYRRAQPWETAVAEIRSLAGRQFDPEIVVSFLGRQKDLREIHRQLAA